MLHSVGLTWLQHAAHQAGPLTRVLLPAPQASQRRSGLTNGRSEAVLGAKVQQDERDARALEELGQVRPGRGCSC